MPFSWRSCILPFPLVIPQINVWGVYLPLPLQDPAFIRAPALTRENTVYIAVKAILNLFITRKNNAKYLQSVALQLFSPTMWSRSLTGEGRLREVPTGSREKSRESQPRPKGAFPWLWRWGRDCEFCDIVSKGCNTISTLQHYVVLKIVVANRPV